MSLNLQVVVGPIRELYVIVTRWPGSVHDSRIFDNSSGKARLEDGRLQGKLLGNNGYPQLIYLFTPILDQLVRILGHRRYNIAHRGTSVFSEYIEVRVANPCGQFLQGKAIRNGVIHMYFD
uniref:DDE Tnp4 domain-containing protein n=1 Tax=Timema bartmani TaxID=61472 RepID=A0A7R9FDL1_9NEOP|nr:unnamed protein product [Timema bartmani]